MTAMATVVRCLAACTTSHTCHTTPRISSAAFVVPPVVVVAAELSRASFVSRRTAVKPEWRSASGSGSGAFFPSSKVSLYLGNHWRITPKPMHTLLFLSNSHFSSSSSKKKKNKKKKKKKQQHGKKKKKEENLLSEEVAEMSPFATDYHAPVMVNECIQYLLAEEKDDEDEDRHRWKKKVRQQQHQRKDNENDTLENRKEHEHEEQAEEIDSKRGRIFVDATLGGGGHSHALLQALNPEDVVIGCDVDLDAIAEASKRLAQYLPESNENESCESLKEKGRPTFLPLQCNFRNLSREVPRTLHHLGLAPHTVNKGMIDGILMDLGVSSYQIDTPDRGFAFMKEGPLDMRMSATSHATTTTTTLTAADVCNTFSSQQLTDLFRTYADEPHAYRIATSIVQNRQTNHPLATTQDLVHAVEEVTPRMSPRGRRYGLTATLARVFQALRIYVNQEEEALMEALTVACPDLVKRGGRLVVLSYHSVEDRIVKRVIRDGVVVGGVPEEEEVSRRRTLVEKRVAQRSGLKRDVYGNVMEEVLEGGRMVQRPWRAVVKRSKATEREVAANSRARSATLRVAERC